MASVIGCTNKTLITGVARLAGSRYSTRSPETDELSSGMDGKRAKPMDESINSEILEGYVVDIACLRKYPQGDLLRRAKAHTRVCSLSGHCLESGYGLVDERGNAALLDPKATLHVLEAVRSSQREAGIQLRVTRKDKSGEMETALVEEVEQPT